MNREEVEAAVLASLSTVLKREVDSQCSRENTPAWDSLNNIEVVFSLEDKLGVQFTEEELLDMGSVDSIVRIVMSRHES